MDRDYEGTPDHPALHSGPLFGVAAHRGDGTEGTVFVQPIRAARSDADDGGRVAFAIGDEPALFDIEPTAGRSLAAALVRIADQLEAG